VTSSRSGGVLRHLGSPISSFKKHTAAILTALRQKCLLRLICLNVRHQLPSYPRGPPTPRNCANLTLHISSALPKLKQTSPCSPYNARNTTNAYFPLMTSHRGRCKCCAPGNKTRWWVLNSSHHGAETFWEPNSSPASQEIPLILRNPMAHCHIHNSLPFGPILCHTSSVYDHPFHFCKTHYNVPLTSRPRFSTWPLSFRFPNQNSVRIFSPHTSHPSLFGAEYKRWRFTLWNYLHSPVTTSYTQMFSGPHWS